MSRMSKSLLWMGVGAAIAYFFDPDRGRSRRARFTDQGAGRLRDTIDEAAGQARMGVDRTAGVVHETLIGDQPPETPEGLMQKVRSEAIGPIRRPEDHVDVDVVSGGTVVLRGAVADAGRTDELVRAVANVTGVTEVRDELHRPV